MRRLWIQLAFISLVAFSASAQHKTFFDVKTKLSEKSDLAPAKAACVILLSRSDWAGVTEVGETYSLWLKNYRRMKEGDKVRVKLDVEIHTPSMIRSGKLLATEGVDVLYDPHEEPDADLSFWVAFRRHVKNTSRDMENEGMTVGMRVVETVREMVKSIKQ